MSVLQSNPTAHVATQMTCTCSHTLTQSDSGWIHAACQQVTCMHVTTLLAPQLQCQLICCD